MSDGSKAHSESEIRYHHNIHKGLKVADYGADHLHLGLLLALEFLSFQEDCFKAQRTQG